MEEALDIGDFLPFSFANRAEGDYVVFLWNTFETNYMAEKYEFASLAFHLLYMSYVSFSIWQIRLVREKEFKSALVGFQSDAVTKLLSADSPFKFYEQLKESQIFRFLKLVGCANDQVGEFSKFVKRRNKIAHPTGIVVFNDKATIDEEIASMMREVHNIEIHMKPVIIDVYRLFLEECSAQDELQYDSLEEEIMSNFIQKNYMSRMDLEICAGFDLAAYDNGPNFPLFDQIQQTMVRHYIPKVREVA